MESAAESDRQRSQWNEAVAQNRRALKQFSDELALLREPDSIFKRTKVAIAEKTRILSNPTATLSDSIIREVSGWTLNDKLGIDIEGTPWIAAQIKFRNTAPSYRIKKKHYTLIKSASMQVENYWVPADIDRVATDVRNAWLPKAEWTNAEYSFSLWPRVEIHWSRPWQARSGVWLWEGSRGEDVEDRPFLDSLYSAAASKM